MTSLNSAKYSTLDQSEADGEVIRMPPPSTSTRTLLYAFLCCLGSVTVGFFLGASDAMRGRVRPPPTPEMQREAPISHPEMANVPELPFVQGVPIVRKTFEHDPSYNFTIEGSNDKWNQLIALGKPYIAIEDPEKYGLPYYFRASATEPEGLQPVAFSLFHQLHCLVCIRHVYMTELLGLESGYHGTCRTQHVEHCLETLRQSIMCSGTMNLERLSFVHHPGQDGFQPKLIATTEVHTCRNWDSLLEIVERLRDENIPVTKEGTPITWEG